MDFVHCGIVDEPELVLRAWLERAVLIAGGVLPNRAVRFVVAPRRTPMFGVWIPSQDALGRSFPLVFLRRLSRSVGSERGSGSFGLGDLPWTLLLAGCSHYLAAAESCLMLGRASSAASVWAQLEALPLPSPRDLSELCADANRVLESERLDAFAARNLGVAASDAEFLSALRRLGPPVRERASGDGGVRDVDSMLGVPAANEFDMFAWLELLRAQRAVDATPRSLFWSPADRRALVSLGAPLPGTLAFLRQQPVSSVQRLPIVNEPDESPAIERELCRLVRRCVTLSRLRAALSGDRNEAGRPPPLPEKKPEAPPASPEPPVQQPPREPRSDSEPPPLKKFSDLTAPEAHFPRAKRPPDTHNFAPEQQPAPRPADIPRTEPLSGPFQPEQPETTPGVAASREGIRFRIPDPPINLSDTDAIEYICALVRERERAEEERTRAEQRRDRIAAEEAAAQNPMNERAERSPEPWREEQTGALNPGRERVERSPQRWTAGQARAQTPVSKRAEHSPELGTAAEDGAHDAVRARAARWREQIGAAEARERAMHERALPGGEQDGADDAHARGRGAGDGIAAVDRARCTDRTHADLVLEHVVERERGFSRREEALCERERDVRRRELALHARERQLRERERAVRHDERARRISQTVAIAERPPAAVRVLEPITLVHGGTNTAAATRNREAAGLTCHNAEPTTTIQAARNRRRGREPVTVVDDGSIRAARVLMIE